MSIHQPRSRKFDSVDDVESRDGSVSSRGVLAAGDADATGPQSASLAKTLEVVSTLREDADDEDDADLLKLCHDVLAPLVAADGGVMYLVKAAGDDVHIHLTGTCAGCPGASLTRDGVIAPAVRTVKPKARVVVTTGYRVPDGAKKI
jgi:Fe-S cluster biogenesis protein NfuA